MPDPPDAIVLEGVRVHNLKSIDVRIPLHRMTVVTGVSGSGKSSLAFDTLYAEGQRRYIESFSPYARQFLERLDKPDADRIDNLPPAVALRQNSVAPGKRSTVATATELYDYLRLLFAKAGRIIDPATGHEVRRDSPQTAADEVARLPHGLRLLVTFPASALPAAAEPDRPSASDRLADEIVERGYPRVVAAGRIIELGRTADAPQHDDSEPPGLPQSEPPGLSRRAAALTPDSLVIVDRLVTGRAAPERLLESLEAAFGDGAGRCALLVEGDADGTPIEIDASHWTRFDFDRRLVSPATGREFPEPTSALFSFRSPLGACPTCRGFGSVPAMSWDKLVPDRSKTLAQGAIVAWTTPAYLHEWEELLDLAEDYDIPTDVPFSDLEPRHLELIRNGVPRRRFGGLKGFFRWLERKRYKIGVAAVLARYRSYETCPDCHGARLNADALAVQVAGRNIAELCGDTVADAAAFFDSLDSTSRNDSGTSNRPEKVAQDDLRLETDPAVTRSILPEIRGRLATLSRLGLGYLTLDRPMATLSGGEARRVALTAAVGADLVNMLYVLDEPSTGLHPRDREQVVETLVALRDGPNTVVVVEHDPIFLKSADWTIDLGPGAGRDGGQVVSMGQASGGRQPPENSKPEIRNPKPETNPKPEIGNDPDRARFGHSDFDLVSDFELHASNFPTVTLSPCTRHNLKHLTVEFPLNRLCVVSGVSGSGKSTLVTETLYPALCRALKRPCDLEDADRRAAVAGADRLDDVILIDASPIGRTPRSNPATYLGAFDPIRAAFAATPEAKLRRFGPGTFSFNTDRGGRCPHCRGAGVVTVDMQFLPDIEVLCPECHGTRFRRDVLEIKLRGRSIAEVLDMTAAEAFAFFRGSSKVQRRLAPLKEVGLDYLPLGQPATTLSGGESQRLKIAAFLGGGKGKRTLFLFDEPTVGLHAADVAKLLDCFRRLIGVGHSIVVVEHRLDVIRAADWLIDLGPEAGEAGGEIVAAGPPDTVAAVPDSVTGRYVLQ